MIHLQWLYSVVQKKTKNYQFLKSVVERIVTIVEKLAF